MSKILIHAKQRPFDVMHIDCDFLFQVENAFDETIKGPWTDMWETWPTTQKTKTDL